MNKILVHDGPLCERKSYHDHKTNKQVLGFGLAPNLLATCQLFYDFGRPYLYERNVLKIVLGHAQFDIRTSKRRSYQDISTRQTATLFGQQFMTDDFLSYPEDQTKEVLLETWPPIQHVTLVITNQQLHVGTCVNTVALSLRNTDLTVLYELPFPLYTHPTLRESISRLRTIRCKSVQWPNIEPDDWYETATLMTGNTQVIDTHTSTGR